MPPIWGSFAPQGSAAVDWRHEPRRHALGGRRLAGRDRAEERMRDLNERLQKVREKRAYRDRLAALLRRAESRLGEQETNLTSLETTLDKDRLWVFPGRGTALGWRMRRWLPQLLWRRIHQVEGR